MRARGARPSAARRPGGAALLLAALVAAAAAGAAHAARVKQAFPVTGDGVCRMGPPCAFKCSSGCINATLVDYQEPMSEIIQRVLRVAEEQAAATITKLQPGQYPYASDDGDGWTTTPANTWTSGFFPGVLWNLHNLTGKAEWRAAAERWTERIANQQRDWSLQHDYGFVYLPSFGEAFAATGSEEARRQVLAAAEATAWAFNPATNSTRTFEGWDPPAATEDYRQPVIMDHIMNIEVLTEGARLGGPRSWLDTSPAAWVDMAVAHARTVARHHIRPDGSTYHIVEYNPVRGTINKRYTYQGYADESTWSRGQAWAMAGFAKMFAATRAPEFWDAAKLVSDRYLSLLMAQEGAGRGGWVPKWDFNAPYEAEFNGPMDSSAASVAALALLTLAEARPDTNCGRRYLCAGVNMLRALASDQYLAQPSDEGGALLLHATANRPQDVALDMGIVWGDYYMLEALEVCRRLPECMGAR